MVGRLSAQFKIRPFLYGALLLVSPQAALAGGGIFGTKTNPLPATTGEGGSMGFMPVAQMFVALLVVLALLKWLMPLLIKKTSRSAEKSSSGIRIKETATLGAGHIYLIEVKGKSLLIGTTPNGMSCLADLGRDPGADLPTFQELIDGSLDRPMGTQKTAMEDIMSQLDRLRKFES